MSIIEFQNIHKSYDAKTQVLAGLSLAVERGELVTLLGPSGCGKTTLLKMVNKLIEPTQGRVLVNGRDIKDQNTIALRRSIGYVIQQVGLLPHLSIRANIGYVQRIMGADKAQRARKAEELIELVGMDKSYLDRYPRQLSGGQKQRVGVARALAADPEIILMDEPFGAVDEIARTQLQDELMRIQAKLKKTILFVTHDIGEAIKLGSRIVLIRGGRVEQAGSKEQLIFEPGSDFVKSFFGLKGFKATLSADVMNKVYDRLLKGDMDIDELYRKLDA